MARGVAGAFLLASSLTVVSAASGGWGVAGPGTAAARALVMPDVAAPSASAVGTQVSVTWSAVTIGGAKVNYLVSRFDASSGTEATIGSSCSGTITTTGCTESNVPPGSWRYAVTPIRDGWVGTRSVRSGSVTIAPAAPTSVALANGGGVGNAYVNLSNRTSIQVAVGLAATSRATDTVSVTLTDRVGTSLTRTAAAPNGSGTVNVGPFDTSTFVDGSVTISATARASTGETSSARTASVTRDTVAPSGTDIQATNRTGGTAGRAEQGDAVTYTFSEPMSPASFVAGWSGTATNLVFRIQNLSPDNFVLLNGTGTQLPFGVTSLGSTAYVSANVDFTSSPATMSGSAIALTLGPTTAANNRFGTVTAATTMTWTPASGPTDLAGNALATASVTEKGTGDADF